MWGWGWPFLSLSRRRCRGYRCAAVLGAGSGPGPLFCVTTCWTSKPQPTPVLCSSSKPHTPGPMPLGLAPWAPCRGGVGMVMEGGMELARHHGHFTNRRLPGPGHYTDRLLLGHHQQSGPSYHRIACLGRWSLVTLAPPPPVGACPAPLWPYGTGRPATVASEGEGALSPGLAARSTLSKGSLQGPRLSPSQPCPHVTSPIPFREGI